MRQKDSGKVVLYRAPDGETSLEVHLEGDTVWLTQAQMAELFKNTKQSISLHTRNIFRERELKESAVVKESLTTARDGKQYRTKHFNLDVIISVGYRVKSKRGTQFRIWATQTLREHLTRGFTLNHQRFENSARELEAALAPRPRDRRAGGIYRESRVIANILHSSFPRKRESSVNGG